MHTKAAIYILLSAAFLFAACRKDLNDDDKPVALIVSPHNGTFSTSVPFNLQFTDNKNLLQYRLAFKYVGTSFDSGDTLVVVKPFNYVWIESIDGTSINKTLNVVLTDTVLPGKYLISLNSVDEAGQESAVDTTTIILKNKLDSIIPAITGLTIGADSTFATTDSVSVLALVTDANTLTHISYNILKSGLVKATTQEYLNTTGFAIDKVLKWTNFEPGNYLLVITVRDKYYNINQPIIPITIN